MTHCNEIKKWADCPNGTRVWSKHSGEWRSVFYPFWTPEKTYIIDDEYAEARKFFVDNEYIFLNNIKISDPSWDEPAEEYSTKKLEWYERSDSVGKVIMIRDNVHSRWSPAIFREYDETLTAPFVTDSGFGWKYARLVTDDDLPGRV